MIAATAQTNLRTFAANEWPRLNHKGRLRELGKLLPWNSRRIRAVYNAESGVSLRAQEATDIEALNRKTEEANRNEFQDLQDRIARIEAALFAADEEFHHDHVAALRAVAGRGRREDVTDQTSEG